ncbi:MAG: LEA type 2 family protein [Phycisphaeraceae bacterium]|nr:LEA type 2 family protein [Phycisphaeraceae bacterium]
MKRFSSAAILVWAIFLASCTVTKPPQVSVLRAEFADRTDDGEIIRFDLVATNASADAIPLRAIRYELILDGKRVFGGTREAEATVRRFGAQIVTIPVAISYRDGQPPRGDVPYELRGTVRYLPHSPLLRVFYDAGLPMPTTSFRDQGVIEFEP